MKICIVGGGTAGWLCSFMLSKARPNNKYVNISSSEIGSIGVGEGTTGLFRQVLNDPFFEIDEYDFMLKTDSLPKLGITFQNWTKEKNTFLSPLEGSITGADHIDSSLFGCILNNILIDDCTKTSFLAKNNKTNFSITNNNLETFDYGLHALHINTIKVGEYFKNLSIKNNVNHLDKKIKNVIVENNQIKRIILEDDSYCESDLFIDCSGFNRVLSKALNQKFIDYSDYLPVNSAFIFDIENDTYEDNPSPNTNAIAMSSGWIFEIPKRTKIGRGYIYCDQFSDDEKILKELKTKYKSNITHKRTLKYKTGRLEESWVGNCISIGLSNCFVEPLQATSIHCTVVQITDFLRNCLMNTIESTITKENAESYNRRTSRLYENMKDFISLHYCGGRRDSNFWKYITFEKKVPDKVKEILELSESRLTRFDDFDTCYGCTNQVLWNYTLAGLNKFKKEKIEECFNTWGLDNNFIIDRIKKHSLEMSVYKNKCISMKTLKKFIN